MIKLIIDSDLGEEGKEFGSVDEIVRYFENLYSEQEDKMNTLENEGDQMRADLASKEDIIEELNGRISEMEAELESAVADYENVKAELEDFNKGKEE